MKPRTILLTFLLALSACTHYHLVKPENRAVVGMYSVEPQIPWSQKTEGRVTVWTVDGRMLAAIYFFNAIKDGEPLFEVRGDEEKVPLFRKDMTASEVLDFVVESIMRTNVTATHLRPFKFGQNRGFRFDLTYLSAEGLDYEGLVAGSIKDDQLYLVIYTGTKVYYYPKYKDDVEQIISSLEILP